MKKLTLEDLIEAEDRYSYYYKYCLFFVVMFIMAAIFCRKRGTVSESILIVLSVLLPLSFALKYYFAFRALKKGKFWIEEGIVEDYFYSYVEFNGKKVKCDIPFDIEVEEKCYCIRNADFAYFIIPARMELDDFLKSKLSNTF